jgi:hypothetical protein
MTPTLATLTAREGQAPRVRLRVEPDGLGRWALVGSDARRLTGLPVDTFDTPEHATAAARDMEKRHARACGRGTM